MNPAAARAALVVASVVVLGISSALTTVTWSLLSFADQLPRALLSLLVFVASYYVGANAIFGKAALRLSPAAPSQRA